jgi:hypothetical protein
MARLQVDECPGQNRIVHAEAMNLYVARWESSLALDGARQIRQVLARRYRELNKRVSSVHVVPLDAALGLPDKETRDELAQMMERCGQMVGCCVIVFEAEGLWASAARSVATGLLTLARRQPYPLTFVRSLDAAVQWLPEPHERFTGERLDPVALRAFFAAAEPLLVRGARRAEPPIAG